MKTTREYTMTTETGHEVKFVGTYASTMEWNHPLNDLCGANFPPHVDYYGSSMVVYVDGQEHARSEYPDSWLVRESWIDGAPTISALNIGFSSQDKADAYMAFLADLMQDDDEVKAFKAAEAAE